MKYGLVALVLLVQLAAKADTPQTWRPLFDGKSLAGWQFASGRPVDKGWQVENGVLHLDDSVGSIYTIDEFADFELRFVWKIAKRGNAGIKYRVRHYDPGIYGPGYLGYEFQMFDDERLRPSPAASTASIYDLLAPVGDKPLRAPGEWNEGRIIATGPRVEHWLNGIRALAVDTSTDDWRARLAGSKFAPIKDFAIAERGRIELQDHEHPVWFKQIEIRELGVGKSSLTRRDAARAH